MGKLCLALTLLAGCVLAQNNANWNTATGNWNNAANWDCVVNGQSGHCVPGAGFQVTAIGGDITLDVNATVASVLGTGGSLTLNGKTFTTTDPLGLQLTGGTINASGGSLISGYVLTGNLISQSSTINAGGSVNALTANISGSTVGSISIAQQLTASNSTFGSSSSLDIVQNSSLSNSTIGGQFHIDQLGILTADNGSVINSTIAQISTGEIAIQGGSTWNHTSTPLSVGLAPGPSVLLINGNSSTLNLTNAALELGQIGDATVHVSNFGKIVATGAGGNIFVGLGVTPFFSTHSGLVVDTAATVTANNIQVAASATGSTAGVEVSDAGSSVTAAGTLRVITGGTVDAARNSSLTVNTLDVQTGSVTVESNASLTLSSDSDVLVASKGTGSLTLATGGTGIAPGQLVVGGSAGAVGTMTVTDFGSRWQSDANVSVGEAGTGTLTVQSGGVLKTGANTDGLSGVLGNQAGGAGTVAVQSGGDWQAAGNLQIGNSGRGILSVLNAGTVESGDVVIGAAAGSNGSANVAGVGSKWTISGDLTVGQKGTGSLGISAAGVVTDVNATLGDKAGSGGSVAVIGLGSSWRNSGILTVGGDGGAGLTIDAGNVTAGGAAFGSNSLPVQVDITNHGSLNVLGDVSIGGGAATDFTVENGGTFDSVNADIGGSGGDTTVTVTGTGSAWTLHGTALLTIDDKGILLVTDGGTVAADTITVDTGGLLDGQDGNIIGNVVNAGGTVTPGDATGITSITGNYTQASGMLLFEIDGLGPGQFDRLLISGLANITGGSIDIQFGNGFVPAVGESFDLLTAGRGLTLSNVTFDVLGLPGGLQFTEIAGTSGLDLTFAPAQATPEPATAAVILLTFAVALATRGRKLPSSWRTVLLAPCRERLRRGGS